MPKRYSDAELNLPERSFTGKEWENGTAQREYIADFKRCLQICRERDKGKREVTGVKLDPRRRPIQDAIEFDDYLEERKGETQ
jgi:hypothetical protein